MTKSAVLLFFCFCFFVNTVVAVHCNMQKIITENLPQLSVLNEKYDYSTKGFPAVAVRIVSV